MPVCARVSVLGETSACGTSVMCNTPEGDVRDTPLALLLLSEFGLQSCTQMLNGASRLIFTLLDGHAAREPSKEE